MAGKQLKGWVGGGIGLSYRTDDCCGSFKGCKLATRWHISTLALGYNKSHWMLGSTVIVPPTFVSLSHLYFDNTIEIPHRDNHPRGGGWRTPICFLDRGVPPNRA